MAKKPMTEQETRNHLISLAKENGLEAPIRAIFARVDEGMKHAQSDFERNMIAMEGLAELDKYFGAATSNLDNVAVKDMDQAVIDKFNKR